jgi:signal transduction histidine kinase
MASPWIGDTVLVSGDPEHGANGWAREAERERRLFQAVIETVPLGIMFAAMDGTIIRANSHALRVLRRPSLAVPEFVEWRQTEAYYLDGRRVPPGQLPLERTLAAGESVVGERLEVVAGGGRVVVEITTAPVTDENGVQIGAVAVLQDATVKERQEHVEREFVTNAAHELQSPIASIVSAIDVLQAGAKDTAERDVFLAHIERAAARLGRVVRALLILARAQSGYEAPKDELVAVASLLRGIAAALRTPAGVQLSVRCADDLAVVTNRELLEQAVANVAENAAKHTKSGRIVLEASAVDGAVEISVADTGPGIQAARRSRVFDRFFHGEEPEAGTGLGLAIVSAAVDALGGDVELDSTVGVGSVVRLRIPRTASLVSR